MLETIKTIGSVASTISVTIAVLGILIKPIRRWLVKKIKDVADSDKNAESINECHGMLESMDHKIDTVYESLSEQTVMIKTSLNASQASLGNSIKHIYYKYYGTKKLPIREKEAIIHMHKPYKETGGNSFVDEIYDEMMKWEVVSN